MLYSQLYNSDPTFKQLVGNMEDAAGPHCFLGNPLDQKMLKRCWENKKIP